jgi:hypothetical protein
LCSYSDQPRTVTAQVEQLEHHKQLPLPWPQFYAQASASKEPQLVKTHLPPQDDQPALYIVRDGRLALRSYHAFHRRFQPQTGASLLSLILGEDYYGDWSWHYRQWQARGGTVLVLRYEELVQPQSDLLHRIGDVLGMRPLAERWHNPVQELRTQRPQLIGSAETQWRAGEWDSYTDAVFHLLHGPLLRELGYADATTCDAATRGLDDAQRELLLATQRATRRAAELQAVCDARQRVIDALVQDRSRLANSTT